MTLRHLIEPDHPLISIRRQCELLGIPRANLYRQPARESAENHRLMRVIDEQFLVTPFYGSRRMAAWLSRNGEPVNRKRLREWPAGDLQQRSGHAVHGQGVHEPTS